MKTLGRTLQRIRSFGGQLGLLAALAGLAAFLASGPPRLANDQTDAGLRADINRLAAGQRDLTFTADARVSVFNPETGQFQFGGAGDRSGELDQIRQSLPGPLPGLVSQSWFIAEVGPASAAINSAEMGSCPQLGAIRRQTGSEQATRVVAGRAPATTGESPLAEAMIGQNEAKALGAKIGDTVTVQTRFGSATARLVGVYQPVDPATPFWADMTLARVACPSPADGLRWRATMLTDVAGSLKLGTATNELSERWRYRLDEQRVTAGGIDELTTAVATARREPPEKTTLVSSLDTTLADFDQRLRGVRALLAVIQAGLLATMAGLILLAARLAVDRRRGEYALIRARGGAVSAIGRRALAETLLVVVPAVAAGWLAGWFAAARPDPAEPVLVLGIALLAAVAPAVLAAAGARHPDFTGHRRDLVATRPTPRQITAELFLIALAAGGTFLVRRRGLDSGAGVDPYLVAVPVLLGLAASLIALRLLPFPLRWAGRLAARARGAVAFLGLTGAGRGAPLRSGPLAVLVIAIATGIFSGTVTSTVGHARDRAADLSVPADAVVTGFAFAPGTAERVAAVPGVDAAAELRIESAANLRSSVSPLITQVQGMVVGDGADLDLPAALTGGFTPGAPAPALVSPRVADRIGGEGFIDVQGRRYPFRVAAVSPAAPGIAAGVQDFVVVPLAAMTVPEYQPVIPNRILIRGSGFATAAVTAAADEGQAEQTRLAPGVPDSEASELAMPAVVTTHAAFRAGLDERGVDGVLSFTFAAGVATAAALALLAVALTVLAGAPARGRTLSRLRTLGLSSGQGRRLLVFEIVPLIAAAVLVGSAAGVALPILIEPALGLGDFTAGVPAGISVDPWLAAGVLVVAIVAVVAALVVEDAANRRLRLGTVLRLGEEQV